MKRFFDIVLSGVAVVLLSPLMCIAAAGIKLTSPGTVLYRAIRAGYKGRPYTMFKFRTMHMHRSSTGSKITGARDSRIFRFGRILRALKIDELPQLFNVIAGDMSIVGPRPEDAAIVERHYTSWMMETLEVRPGMASPGSLYGSMLDYTREKRGIVAEDPEKDYIDNILPMKLAVELVYVRNATLWYDLKVILRTIGLILLVLSGKREFGEFPEEQEARNI